MEATVGSRITGQIDDCIVWGTEATVFKGYYDLYIESMLVEVVRIFKELMSIGVANEGHLESAPWDWAESQMSSLIRSKAILMRNWVREVCDEQPSLSLKEMLVWREWRAPAFLAMKPNGTDPWDAASAWNRDEAEGSQLCLDHFEDLYVTHLEFELRRAAGEAAVEFAKVHRADIPPQMPAVRRTGASRRETLPSKKLTAAQLQKQSIIFGALQIDSKGRAYCKNLTDRGLKTPDSWIAGGCPPTYAEAYVAESRRWRKRIHDEKHRYAKAYVGTPAAERE